MPSLGSLRFRSQPGTTGRGATKARSSLSVFTDALALASKTSLGSSNGSAATVDVLLSQVPLTPSSSVSSGLDSVLNTLPSILLTRNVTAVALDEEVFAFEQLERNIDASLSRKQKRKEKRMKAQTCKLVVLCAPHIRPV